MPPNPEDLVLEAIRGGSGTVEGLSRATRLHANSVRSAIRSLLRAGKIRDGRETGDWAVAWYELTSKSAMLHTAAKALPPEKLQELLLKIRKGATSSITLAQLDSILETMGGKIVPFVGFDRDPDPARGRDVAMYHIHDRAGSPEEVLARFKSFIRPIPAKPKVGEVYITSAKLDVNHGDPVVAYQAALAVAGIRVTAPNGETKEFLSRSPIGRLPIHEIATGYSLPPATKAPPSYQPLGWLVKDTDFMARVNAALNMEEHKPAEQRSRDGTGSCPVCFANVKIKPKGSSFMIVLHGYKRPGHGRTEGKCFGVGYPPFELSAEGSKDYVTKFVIPGLAHSEEWLAKLNSGQLTELMDVGTWTSKPVTKDSPRWDSVLKNTIERAEQEVRWFKNEKEDFQKLIARWVERPLPKEGDSLFAVRFASERVSAENVVRRFLDR